MAVPDIEVLGGGEPVLSDVEAGRAVPENDQTVCIGVGKRTKQQAIYDAEDSGVRANADGKRKKRGDGEGARSDQDATSMAQIFSKE